MSVPTCILQMQVRSRCVFRALLSRRGKTDWRPDFVSAGLDRLDLQSFKQVQECATDTKIMPPVSTVNVELSKETLDTMLDGLGKIRDQLSSVAKKWWENILWCVVFELRGDHKVFDENAFVFAKNEQADWMDVLPDYLWSGTAVPQVTDIVLWFSWLNMSPTFGSAVWLFVFLKRRCLRDGDSSKLEPGEIRMFAWFLGKFNSQGFEGRLVLQFCSTIFPPHDLKKFAPTPSR